MSRGPSIPFASSRAFSISPAVRKKLQEKGFETSEIRKLRIPGETIYVYERALSLIGERVRGEATSEAVQE
jgi:hypothetical protein